MICEQKPYEAKRLEMALQELESQCRVLIENSPMGIFVIQNERFRYMNSRLLTILGYKREDQVIERPFDDVIYLEDRSPVNSMGLKRKRTHLCPGRFTCQALTSDESIIWVDISIFPITYMKKPAKMGCLLDITDLKDIEDKMAEEMKKYEILLNEIEDGYSEVDLSGNTTFANESSCRIVGYPRDEIIGLNYKDYMSKETAKKVYQAYNEVYNVGLPNELFSYEIIRKDKARRIIENSISLIKGSAGVPTGFRSIIRDITERKFAEQELAKHRTLLEGIFQSVDDAIITVDTDMKIIEANKATEKICGRARKNTIGKAFINCMNCCSHSCHEAISNALRQKTAIKGYHIECKQRDHPHQIVVASVSPLLRKDGKFLGVVFIARDITRLNDLERELRERHKFHNIVGKSKKMQDVYKLLDDLNDLETTVVVTGETGTGKELVAEALHYSGSRAFKTFVKVNCSALSENLLESELFGHVKGAFTGAVKDKVGRFQVANGGTILLDEIGDISPRIQLKLLRFLEEKEFERVGESIPRKVDVRFIACTNKNLRKKVELGEFREDLYYRLKVIEIELPPLRERLDDIPLLVDHFLRVFNKKFKKNIEGMADDVLNVFLRYPWPGNIREMEHVIERAFVLCRTQTIRLDHISSEIIEYSDAKRIFLKSPDETPQKILDILNKTDWNKAKAARLLGMSRQSLYRKVREYGLSKSM